MHQPPSAWSRFSRPSAPLSRTRQHGFSLVEVTLAIGIIAFAFVALFGLIPAGLTVFRQSIDSANEMWIMQGFNSMVQTTDWANVKGLSYESSKEIYYFDEEGRLTDTEKRPNTKREADRLYAAKLIVEDLQRPGTAISGDPMPYGYRILAVMATVQNPQAMADFKKVEDAEALTKLPKETVVRTRSFVVARMDSEKGN